MNDDEIIALQRKLASLIREAGDTCDALMQSRLADMFIANPHAIVPWPVALAVAARDPRLRDALAQVMQVEMARGFD